MSAVFRLGQQWVGIECRHLSSLPPLFCVRCCDIVYRQSKPSADFFVMLTVFRSGQQWVEIECRHLSSLPPPVLCTLLWHCLRAGQAKCWFFLVMFTVFRSGQQWVEIERHYLSSPHPLGLCTWLWHHLLTGRSNADFFILARDFWRALLWRHVLIVRSWGWALPMF